MIEITVLGTTAGAPTKERGHSAVAVKHNGKAYLFDCGENAQRQAKIAGISLLKIKSIFITHWHADHFAGLVGLIQTMALLERKAPLYIFGPKPGKLIVDTINRLNEQAHFASQLNLGYDLIVREVEEGLVLAEDDIIVECTKALHTLPAVSYKFAEKDKPGRFNLKKAKSLGLKPPQFGELQRGNNQKVGAKIIKPSDVMGEPRPGLKFVYSGDTGYNENLAKFAAGADLLIHEATYTEEMLEEGKMRGHSTATQAAAIAKKAKAKELLLTHFSSRYKNTKGHLVEAQKVFKNTKTASDMLKIILK